MDFVAIDFETANERRESACQLAAVVVRAGSIVERKMWMIRPRPSEFRPMHIAIHGITPERVASEPEFAALWPEIEPVVRGRVLLAHNAGFDLGVLRASLQSFRLPVPEMPFVCSRLIARRAWPGHVSYGLKAAASRLGIEFRHHDALEDAIACAQVALAAAEQVGARSLEELESRLQLERGLAGFWGVRNPCRTGYRRRGRASARGQRPGLPRRWQAAADQAALVDVASLIEAARGRPALQGRTVVFTGRLRFLSRTDATGLAEALGGRCQESVTRTTAVLVTGELDERTRAAGRSKSTKQERAEQLKAQGQAVEILSEAQFLELARGGCTRAAGAERV